MKIFTVTMTPVNPPYDDGAKNIVMNIARRIRKYDFLFVSSFFDRSFDRENNIDYLRSPFQRIGRHSMSLCQKIYVFMLIILNIRSMNVLQFFITPQPLFSRVFRRVLHSKDKKSVQIVSSIHTLYEKNREGSLKHLFFGDRIVVFSDYARKKLEEAGTSGVVRIYPGIDTDRFSPDGSDSTTHRILYPGTYRVLKESYSFENFCEIIRNVLKTEKDVEIIMACRIRTHKEVLFQKEFMKMTEDYGIKEHFVFMNTVDDMPSLYRTCDIGIMPAERSMSGVLEIPMVILEMASSGKPVVYGKVSPLSELSDKGLGSMVEDGSPEAYSKNVLELIHNKTLAEDTGSRSRETVITHFNIDNMAREFEDLYDLLEKEA